MSRHSKHGIRIQHPDGNSSWTTKRSARRLVDRGLASWVDERNIRMVAQDHRLYCERPAAGVPCLEVSTRALPPVEVHGYLHYPYRPDETLSRWQREIAARAG